MKWHTAEIPLVVIVDERNTIFSEELILLHPL